MNKNSTRSDVMSIKHLNVGELQLNIRDILEGIKF